MATRDEEIKKVLDANIAKHNAKMEKLQEAIKATTDPELVEVLSNYHRHLETHIEVINAQRFNTDKHDDSLKPEENPGWLGRKALFIETKIQEYNQKQDTPHFDVRSKILYAEGVEIYTFLQEHSKDLSRTSESWTADEVIQLAKQQLSNKTTLRQQLKVSGEYDASKNITKSKKINADEKSLDNSQTNSTPTPIAPATAPSPSAPVPILEPGPETQATLSPKPEEVLSFFDEFDADTATDERAATFSMTMEEFETQWKALAAFANTPRNDRVLDDILRLYLARTDQIIDAHKMKRKKTLDQGILKKEAAENQQDISKAQNDTTISSLQRNVRIQEATNSEPLYAFLIDNIGRPWEASEIVQVAKDHIAAQQQTVGNNAAPPPSAPDQPEPPVLNAQQRFEAKYESLAATEAANANKPYITTRKDLDSTIKGLIEFLDKMPSTDTSKGYLRKIQMDMAQIIGNSKFWKNDNTAESPVEVLDKKNLEEYLDIEPRTINTAARYLLDAEKPLVVEEIAQFVKNKNSPTNTAPGPLTGDQFKVELAALESIISSAEREPALQQRLANYRSTMALVDIRANFWSKNTLIQSELENAANNEKNRFNKAIKDPMTDDHIAGLHKINDSVAMYHFLAMNADKPWTANQIFEMAQKEPLELKGVPNQKKAEQPDNNTSQAASGPVTREQFAQKIEELDAIREKMQTPYLRESLWHYRGAMSCIVGDDDDWHNDMLNKKSLDTMVEWYEKEITEMNREADTTGLDDAGHKELRTYIDRRDIHHFLSENAGKQWTVAQIVEMAINNSPKEPSLWERVKKFGIKTVDYLKENAPDQTAEVMDKIAAVKKVIAATKNAYDKVSAVASKIFSRKPVVENQPTTPAAPGLWDKGKDLWNKTISKGQAYMKSWKPVAADQPETPGVPLLPKITVGVLGTMVVGLVTIGVLSFRDDVEPAKNADNEKNKQEKTSLQGASEKDSFTTAAAKEEDTKAGSNDTQTLDNTVVATTPEPKSAKNLSTPVTKKKMIKPVVADSAQVVVKKAAKETSISMVGDVLATGGTDSVSRQAKPSIATLKTSTASDSLSRAPEQESVPEASEINKTGLKKNNKIGLKGAMYYREQNQDSTTTQKPVTVSPPGKDSTGNSSEASVVNPMGDAKVAATQEYRSFPGRVTAKVSSGLKGASAIRIPDHNTGIDDPWHARKTFAGNGSQICDNQIIDTSGNIFILTPRMAARPA